MCEESRAYQDYEVFGTEGRVWRTGDRSRPNVFIQDRGGGTWRAGMDDWMYKPVQAEQGTGGEWRPVEPGPLFGDSAVAEGYRRFARMILEGAEHPMSGEMALRGFDVVMAVYESARLGRKVRLPLVS